MQTVHKKYFRTAEFAQMANLNKKTLHYYDEIGLFKPAFVNEKGYRFYTLPQLDRLALIAALKDLGVPLKEIKEYMECGDAGRLDRMLEEQSQEIDRRIGQLRRSQELLRSLQAENRAFQRYCGKGYLVLEWPAERITLLVDEQEFPQMPKAGMVVNYLTDGPCTGICYGGEAQFLYQKRADGERTIPGGRYLCLYGEESEGTTQELRLAVIGRMRQWAAEQGLRLDEDVLIEFSDVLTARPGSQYFCIRARLAE